MVWQSFGPHRLRLGSIMDHELLDRQAEILFSDPPWSDGMLKAFATITARHTGRVPKQPTFARLADRFADVIDSCVTRWVFIECSTRTIDVMSFAILRRIPSFRLRVVEFTYGRRGQKAAMIQGGLWDWPPVVDLAGARGVEIRRRCLAPVAVSFRQTSGRGARVLDPCCGSGLVARAALPLGMMFIGNELNPSRHAIAAKFLERNT
jgi:hypothetical protein